MSLEEPDIDTGMVHEALRCLDFFHSHDPTITQDSLKKMAIKTTEGHITLQHHLAQILRGPQRDRVMSQFQEPREIAWCESLQDNSAGLWLDCAPKLEMHKIANDEFRAALTHCSTSIISVSSLVRCATVGRAGAQSLSTATGSIRLLAVSRAAT